MQYIEEVDLAGGTMRERMLRQLFQSNYSSAFTNNIKDQLGVLKANGVLQKWESTVIEPSRWSAVDLQLLARTSFSCADYYNDIVMKGALPPADDANAAPGFVILAVTSVLLAAFVVPQLPVDATWKNILGLALLGGPLFSVGHFLAGYLCGVPILEYSLPEDVRSSRESMDGSRMNAGTALLASVPSLAVVVGGIDRSDKDSKPSLPAILRASRTGPLLISSMAGMVAESLRFGDCRGGREDLPLARSILRGYGVPRDQVEEYLRWAVGKALALLRVHRDSFDAVAAEMLRAQDVPYCMARIEDVTDN
eukprot:gene29174-38238_t